MNNVALFMPIRHSIHFCILAKRNSPEYQNECHMKRLTAVKEGRKGARCSFHCFLSTNSETQELEVYRVDVSIKSDRRR